MYTTNYIMNLMRNQKLKELIVKNTTELSFFLEIHTLNYYLLPFSYLNYLHPYNKTHLNYQLRVF